MCLAVCVFGPWVRKRTASWPKKASLLYRKIRLYRKAQIQNDASPLIKLWLSRFLEIIHPSPVSKLPFHYNSNPPSSFPSIHMRPFQAYNTYTASLKWTEEPSRTEGETIRHVQIFLKNYFFYSREMCKRPFLACWYTGGITQPVFAKGAPAHGEGGGGGGKGKRGGGGKIVRFLSPSGASAGDRERNRSSLTYISQHCKKGKVGLFPARVTWSWTWYLAKKGD